MVEKQKPTRMKSNGEQGEWARPLPAQRVPLPIWNDNRDHSSGGDPEGHY
jgi:hypothetical protein